MALIQPSSLIPPTVKPGTVVPTALICISYGKAPGGGSLLQLQASPTVKPVLHGHAKNGQAKGSTCCCTAFISYGKAPEGRHTLDDI